MFIATVTVGKKINKPIFIFANNAMLNGYAKIVAHCATKIIQ
jgi:hypothetical protein